MQFIVFITLECDKMAKNHSVLSEVKKLSQKIEIDQSISSWECFLPDPIIRKALGSSYRLVATKHNYENHIVISFIGVYPRGGSEYEKFCSSPSDFVKKLVPSDEELKDFIKKMEVDGAELRTRLESPNETEYGYLYITHDDDICNTLGIIFESHDWVRLIQKQSNVGLLSRFYDLVNTAITADEKTTILEDREFTILFRRFEAENVTLLIAPISKQDRTEADRITQQYRHILEMKSYDHNDILRYSSRSYPKLILAHDEQTWHEIEKNAEGNLALSPEEANIFKEMTFPENTSVRYPLFINGRPGSGKSTILQYLFSEHLFQHLNKHDRLPKPPIYLTYSERLLTAAKKAVLTILNRNSKYITQEMSLSASEINSIITQSFAEFHSFILQFLPEELRIAKFKSEKFINYSKFRAEWNKFKITNPDQRIRRMSPELTWHVIRTLIKGKATQSNEYFGIESFSELSSEQKTVSEDNFCLIYEKVWQNWYKPLCEVNSYWDNQDLTRAVLDHAKAKEIAAFPAIYCDEAQDFTSNELELILRLSLFSQRNINATELSRVPFAFAGDPFQTLNPSGFNWNVVKAGFHERIIKHLDRVNTGKLNMNYKELSFNYRSSKSIVGFSNLIQLLRGLLFEINNLRPQKTWFCDRYNKHFDSATNANRLPQYFNIENESCSKALHEHSELIIILPCQEGEEIDYVREDPFLSNLTKDHYTRNFLSPMQAKGLEFSNVVLYKFGDDLANTYPDIFNPIASRKPHSGDNALPYEYFINRLYVAASRAKSTLIIIDTDKGISALWGNPEIFSFDSLTQQYNEYTDTEWKVDDLSLVAPGQDINLFEKGENAQDIADAFLKSGTSEQDSYLLRLAAANYRRIHNENEAKKCEALAYEFEKEYVKAAQLYLSVGNKERALELLWITGSFNEIASQNLFVNSIYQKAALFYTKSKSDVSFASISLLLAEIYKAYKNAPILFVSPYYENWVIILERLVNSLSRQEENADVNYWRNALKMLRELSATGLVSMATTSFARIAFGAGNYLDAIQIWDENSHQKHAHYYMAKSKVTKYPDNLEWLVKAGDLKKATRYYEENPVPLTKEQFAVFFDYYIKEERLSDALKMALEDPDTSSIKKLFSKINKLDIDEQDALLQLFANQAFSADKWDDIISIWSKQDLEDYLKLRINPYLIERIAKSKTFRQCSAERKKKISIYLRKYLIDQPWQPEYNLMYAASAIEKADKIIDALDFYELIWSAKSIPATKEEEQFARLRWLKRKKMLSEIGTKTRKQHLAEITKKMEEWDMKIDLDALPLFPEPDVSTPKTVFTGLTNHEKEVIANMFRIMPIENIAAALKLNSKLVREYVHSLQPFNTDDNEKAVIDF